MHIRHMPKRTMDITKSITPTSVSVNDVSAERNEHFGSPGTVSLNSLIMSTLQCLISDTSPDSALPRAMFVMTFLSI